MVRPAEMNVARPKPHAVRDLRLAKMKEEREFTLEELTESKPRIQRME